LPIEQQLFESGEEIEKLWQAKVDSFKKIMLKLPKVITTPSSFSTTSEGHTRFIQETKWHAMLEQSEVLGVDAEVVTNTFETTQIRSIINAFVTQTDKPIAKAACKLLCIYSKTQSKSLILFLFSHPSEQRTQKRCAVWVGPAVYRSQRCTSIPNSYRRGFFLFHSRVRTKTKESRWLEHKLTSRFVSISWTLPDKVLQVTDQEAALVGLRLADYTGTDSGFTNNWLCVIHLNSLAAGAEHMFIVPLPHAIIYLGLSSVEIGFVHIVIIVS